MSDYSPDPRTPESRDREIPTLNQSTGRGVSLVLAAVVALAVVAGILFFTSAGIDHNQVAQQPTLTDAPPPAAPTPAPALPTPAPAPAQPQQ